MRASRTASFGFLQSKARPAGLRRPRGHGPLTVASPLICAQPKCAAVLRLPASGRSSAARPACTRGVATEPEENRDPDKYPAAFDPQSYWGAGRARFPLLFFRNPDLSHQWEDSASPGEKDGVVALAHRRGSGGW